jgi:hypothetical protein
MRWKARHVGTAVDVRGRRGMIGTRASGAAIRPSRSRGKFEAVSRGRAMRIRALGAQHCRAILCEELARAGRGCFTITGKLECVDDGGCVGLRHQKPAMMMEPLRRLRTWVSLARTPRVRWGESTATYGAFPQPMRLAGRLV